jgi:phosphoglycerate dehydrogenase-like enzyme
MSKQLRVVVATPLSKSLGDLITRREPRIELVLEPSLLPPVADLADSAEVPSFRRTERQQQAFEAMVDSADALFGIPDTDPAALRRTVLANPRLQWVHTVAAGGGSQVRAAQLTRHQLGRVLFTTSAGVHAKPLAEFALFGLLAGAKKLERLAADQRNRHWAGSWLMDQLGQQTILVVGLGGIGRQVVAVLAALGTRLIGTSRRDVSVSGVSRVIHPEDLPAVAPEIDGAVATLPGTDATAGLLGKTFFDALRPGATIVNVGRGSVIDEEALIAALRSGKVGFAALDVFATEPLPTDSPLWQLPNVLVSPHTAARSMTENRLIADLFAQNATRLLNREELINRVNTVEFY